jgi:type V secretory pathway adhesin AidA
MITITPVNPLTSRTHGAKGAVNINKRADAGVHDVVIRLTKKSASDVLLNTWRNQDQPVIINGTMVENYVNDGADAREDWVLEGGSITTQPSEVKNNIDGSDVVEYTIQFSSAIRNI